eukprot:3968246-Alexandrium_andersonii.AAC.1
MPGVPRFPQLRRRQANGGALGARRARECGLPEDTRVRDADLGAHLNRPQAPRAERGRVRDLQERLGQPAVAR